VSSHKTLLTYSKGETIYWQHDEAREVFLLCRGRVELSHVTPDGKRLKLATIRPVAFFGEVSVSQGTTHFATAIAVDDVQVLVLGREETEMLLHKRPRVALQLIRELNRQLTMHQVRLVALAYYDVPTRIAVELLSLSQEEQTTSLTLTHQALGERAGLMRESVTRTLRTFEKAGLVELHRGKLHLRDVAGLQNLLRSNGINRFLLEEVV
jgi:CRP/FNR family cyclic AMP-dependent transcriptional regulator